MLQFKNYGKPLEDRYFLVQFSLCSKIQLQLFRCVEIQFGFCSSIRKQLLEQCEDWPVSSTVRHEDPTTNTNEYEKQQDKTMKVRVKISGKIERFEVKTVRMISYIL